MDFSQVIISNNISSYVDKRYELFCSVKTSDAIRKENYIKIKFNIMHTLSAIQSQFTI